MKEKHTELSLLVEQAILGESVEQIDELKKETLVSYAKKSVNELPAHQRNVTVKSTGPRANAHDGAHPKTGETPIQWDMRKVKNRSKGIGDVVDKLSKGQYQESILDQLSAAIEYLDEDQIQIVAEMVAELMEAENQVSIEESIYSGDYIITSETSKYGGHRPKIVHKESGRTMYLGGDRYATQAKARGHAKEYLHGYATGGEQGANKKSTAYAKAHSIKEEVSEENGFDVAAYLKREKAATKAAGGVRKRMKQYTMQSYKELQAKKKEANKLAKGQYQEEYIEEARQKQEIKQAPHPIDTDHLKRPIARKSMPSDESKAFMSDFHPGSTHELVQHQNPNYKGKTVQHVWRNEKGEMVGFQGVNTKYLWHHDPGAFDTAAQNENVLSKLITDIVIDEAYRNI